MSRETPRNPSAHGISEVADTDDDLAASLEEITATAEAVAKQAEEIEASIAETTDGAAEQRDAIDDYLNELADLGGVGDSVASVGATSRLD